jgi:glutaredoxin
MTATKKRKVEVFTAWCPVCDDAVKLVKSLACDSCEVEVLDMKQADFASRAKGYGVRSVPAVVIDGKLADCCSGRGPDADTLRVAGLGQAV